MDPYSNSHRLRRFLQNNRLSPLVNKTALAYFAMQGQVKKYCPCSTCERNMFAISSCYYGLWRNPCAEHMSEATHAWNVRSAPAGVSPRETSRVSRLDAVGRLSHSHGTRSTHLGLGYSLQISCQEMCKGDTHSASYIKQPLVYMEFRH